MVIQNLLDLARVNIKAAGDYQIFGAIHDIEKAIFIHLADIAGTHPAIDKNVARLLFAVPVALHNIGTLHHDLANLTGRQELARLTVANSRFDAGERQANAAITTLIREGITMGDRSRLAQPIAL